MRKAYHVVPSFDIREHNTESLECWCKPTVEQPCTQCDGEKVPNCWRCRGKGWVEQHGDPALVPTVVVHNKGGLK